MAGYRYPLIAREGWPAIGLTGVAAILAYVALSPWAGIGLALVLAALLWLFRDPRRKIPSSPLAAVCPVDGRVLELEQGARDPWLDRSAVRLLIEVNALGVYSVRAPVEGKVMRQWFPGVDDDAPARAQWIQTDEMDDVVVVVKSARLTGSRYCRAHSGERIGQGQRCGYLPFGGVVELWLPENVRLGVQAGDRTLSGVTVLGTLVHG